MFVFNWFYWISSGFFCLMGFANNLVGRQMNQIIDLLLALIVILSLFNKEFRIELL